MPVLTTLAKLKTHLGIAAGDTTEDTLLNQILTEIDQVCFRFCKRTFSSAAATEYYDGTGRELLALKRRPVTAVAGVWVDSTGYYGQRAGAFDAATTAWTAGDHFVSPSLVESEENGGLLLAIGGNWPTGAGLSSQASQGIWPVGRGNVKVTYTAGYATIPADLELAAHYLAAAVRQAASGGTAGPIGSETFGEYSYSLLRGGDLQSSGLDIVTARNTLARYRDVAI